MWVRRPLVPMAAGMAMGIWGTDKYGDVFFLILIGTVLSALAGFYREILPIRTHPFPDPRGMRMLVWILIAFMGIGGLLAARQNAGPFHLPVYKGDKVTMIGTVTGVSQKEDSTQIQIKIRELNGKKIKEKTLARISGEKGKSLVAIIGKEVLMEGEVSLPGERRNPGTFDYRRYLKTQKIYGLIREGKILEQSPGPVGVYGWILHKTAWWKEHLFQEMAKRIPLEYSTMLMGMMFGETEGLDEGILDQFRKNGTAHILAVSGLHVGMVYASVSLLLPRGRLGKDLVILFLLFLYVVLASFSPSVLRAFLMILIHMLGKRLYCRYDLLSSASLAFILLLVLNPNSLFNPGFQLSFLAISSLALFLPVLEKLFRSSLVSMILALPLGLSPFTAYLFNYVSLAGLLLNPPVVFLTGILIPGALLLVPLTLIPGLGGPLDLMGHFLRLVLEVLLQLNQLFFVPGRSYWNVISPDAFHLFLYYLVLFIGATENTRWFIRRMGKGWVYGFGLLVLLAVLIRGLLPGNPFHNADAVFVDVGQGDCIHLRTDRGKHILIDGGGNKDWDVGTQVLLPYLLKNRVSQIDLAVVTHLHTDHFDGIASLARQGMIQKLLLYEAYRLQEEEIIAYTGMKKEDLIYVVGGMSLLIDGSTRLNILNPPQGNAESYKRSLSDSADENKNSLVLIAEIGGGRLLLTGDITEEGERMLMDHNSDIRSDVLKVAHHGSKSSSGQEFLDRVSPGSAVIQVGTNYYGHPSPVVLKRLEELEIPVFRNDKNGAVALRFEANGTDGSGIQARYTVLHGDLPLMDGKTH